MNTWELFQTIAYGGFSKTFHKVPDFDPDELAGLLEERIVPTRAQPFAIAREQDDPTDCSHRTNYFDWHSDGLYHETPPRLVLLHCLDPGTAPVHTELAKVDDVLLGLDNATVDTLKKLRSYYIGHNFITGHPMISADGMLLASRGYVSAWHNVAFEDLPSIRETTAALGALYAQLDAHAVSYAWQKGDTLVFKQREHLHRRNSSSIDRDRKLIRMWFT